MGHFLKNEAFILDISDEKKIVMFLHKDVSR